MDRLKNGGSMPASSKSTAQAIVADLLRRINVGALKMFYGYDDV